MASNKKTSGGKSVTIADILTVIGFLGILFTTFMGSMMLTGVLSDALISCAALLCGGILFLWLLAVAKKASNNRQAWFITEMALLVAFVALFAVFTSQSRHFLYMYSQQETLKRHAMADRTKMLQLIEDFKDNESKVIKDIYRNYTANISESVKYNPGNSREIGKWKRADVAVAPDTIGGMYEFRDVTAFAKSREKYLKEQLLIEGADSIKRYAEEQLESIVAKLESQDGFENYHKLARDYVNLYTHIGDELTELSKSQLKFKVRVVGNTLIEESVGGEDYTTNPDNLLLPAYFNGKARSTNAGWYFTAAMLLLIITSYLAVKRSRRVTAMSGGIFSGRKSQSKTGGINTSDLH